MKQIVLEMNNISKRFPGVVALDSVSLSLIKGEVHAICGENGAGKSTLMKILNGIYHADEGEIFIKGKKAKIQAPLQAQEKGLSIIFQEFNLVDTLSAGENIFLGRQQYGKNKAIKWDEMNREAQKLLEHIGCEINPKTPVSELSVSQKQMVEIAKALSYNAEIIVMDEPSATLTEKETDNLYNIVRELKMKEITVVYISHKMDEIFELADRVTVLRDGKLISTSDIQDTCRERLISEMVGRDIDQEFPTRESKVGRVVLDVKNISRKEILQDLSFELHAGEVLGIAGLVGAGRTELVRAIFGADPVTKGEVYKDGKKIKLKNPMHSIKNKIALLTEDRKGEGLILEFSVKRNITITKLKEIIRFGLVNEKKEGEIADEYVQKLKIKTPSANHLCINLSGGNQQKLVLAKWLYADADILILDEPTRGIDVGSKYEIYLIINQLIEMGKSVIMISSELPEVLAMSDRILVMHKGKFVGEFDNRDKSVLAEQVLNCAIG